MRIDYKMTSELDVLDGAIEDYTEQVRKAGRDVAWYERRVRDNQDSLAIETQKWNELKVRLAAITALRDKLKEPRFGSVGFVPN